MNTRKEVAEAKFDDIFKNKQNAVAFIDKWKTWSRGDADIEKRVPYRKRGFTNKHAL